jgi:peptidylprolyl isomerase
MSLLRSAAVLALLAAVVPSAAAAQYSKSPRAVRFDPSLMIDTTKITYAPGGLGSIELQAGTGELPRMGQRVTVHYVGRIAATGKQFDSSRDRGEPFTFTLGAGEVIRGWDLGVAGMLKGERRILIVPPALGYGNAGAGPDIPPGATLVFDVEVIDIK